MQWPDWGFLFASKVWTKRTVRKMTPEEAKAFDAAFGAMDEAFAAMDKVFADANRRDRK